MNRFFRICFLCVAGALLFLAGMWYSSYLFEKNTEKIYGEIRTYEDVADDEPEDVIPMVEASLVPTLDFNTEFIVIKENAVTGESIEIAEELPSQFVGMSRKELDAYYDNYVKCPALNDREEGFVDARIESYSQQKLVVKKVYEPLYLEEKFYLKSEENYIVVYYADQITVYMYTGICMDHLPEETRLEIEAVKEIDSYESLYSFLESYTS